MYLMAYFRTNAEALHLALSSDGLLWQTLNNNEPVWHSRVGGKSIRDPFIMRSQDGLFHLFSTNGWADAALIHARSHDLITWFDEELIPVMHGLPGVRNVWAPECFYNLEDDLYQLIWSSFVTDANHVENSHQCIWGATTRDFHSFSPSTLFFDPGYSVIDACVVRHDNHYLMAFKDERGRNEPDTLYKAIRVCSAAQTSGPWSDPSELLTPPLSEGPTLFQRGGGWTMFYDLFLQNRFGAAFSHDGFTWDDISDQVTFPDSPRHASVLEIDNETGYRLMKTYCA